MKLELALATNSARLKSVVHVTEGQSQQDRLNDLYTLIAFSLVLELPSNNYGKSPLIIFTLPESAIAEIGRRSEETSRPPPKGAD